MSEAQKMRNFSSNTEEVALSYCVSNSFLNPFCLSIATNISQPWILYFIRSACQACLEHNLFGIVSEGDAALNHKECYNSVTRGP